MSSSLKHFHTLFQCSHLFLQCLCSLPPSSADSAVSGQLQLSQGWSTLLCVAATHQQLFCLSKRDLQVSLLEQLLCAVASQLDPAPPSTSPRVMIAEELSMLSVILVRKWVTKGMTLEKGSMDSFLRTLSSCSGLDVSVSCNICLCAYSSLVQLLNALHSSNQVDGGVWTGELPVDGFDLSLNPFYLYFSSLSISVCPGF